MADVDRFFAPLGVRELRLAGPVPGSPANRDCLPGFAAPLTAKDLNLAADALRAGGVDTQLGLKAAELYTSSAEGDGAGLDFSAIVRTIRGSGAATEHTTKDGTNP